MAVLGVVALAFTGLGISHNTVIAWSGLAALIVGFRAMASSGRDISFKKY